jgi:hypothetical protein
LVEKGHNSMIIAAEIELDPCFDITYLHAKYKHRHWNPYKAILWKPIISPKIWVKGGITLSIIIW